SVLSSIVIGFIAGLIVVVSVIFIDSKLHIDDPVGATSVHLVCGVWGTLAVGIFSPDVSFGVQLLGVVVYGITSFIAAFILFKVIDVIMGVRVEQKEEFQGLDIGEHGMES
ncbi:MAG: ammonium transporter, partial [Phototrophicales bacterium]